MFSFFFIVTFVLLFAIWVAEGLCRVVIALTNRLAVFSEEILLPWLLCSSPFLNKPDFRTAKFYYLWQIQMSPCLWIKVSESGCCYCCHFVIGQLVKLCLGFTRFKFYNLLIHLHSNNCHQCSQERSWNTGNHAYAPDFCGGNWSEFCTWLSLLWSLGGERIPVGRKLATE